VEFTEFCWGLLHTYPGFHYLTYLYSSLFILLIMILDRHLVLRECSDARRPSFEAS